jgi:ribonuclease III
MELSTLETKLGIAFASKEMLEQAFIHRSYLNENRDFHLNHNERLEFLGDAVLELVVTEHLYDNYPDKPEGELTAWRAALVNTKMLASIGRELEFSNYLRLSRGEAKETGKARDYILANTVEAFIGAAYLDQGLKVAEKFIITYIFSKLPQVLEEKLFEDAKSHFQEVAQEKTSITPSYTVLKDWGPDHAKNFKIGVYLNKELAGEGEGSSKQEAEQNAAQNALKNKGWE